MQNGFPSHRPADYPPSSHLGPGHPVGHRRIGHEVKPHQKNHYIMLSWAITFLVIALIAAVLGFGGIAGTAVGIAKLLFFVFLILFVVSLFFGRRPPVA